jgi:SlyX protein
MSTPSSRDIESRIDDLEVKNAFMEDTLERLNDVVVRQQRQIDRLLLQVTELREQQASTAVSPGFRSLRDELPPHY